MTIAVGLAALSAPDSAPGDQRVTTGTVPPATVTEVLAPDQATLTGTLSKVLGEKVVAPPLALPLTLTVPRGGGTKADFSGGAVGGKTATISWDGGRPLPLSGQGSIDFNGPVDVEIDARGPRWALDGAARLLTPGSYSFGSTVAVSVAEGGLATPRDRARLEVPAGTTASFTTQDGVQVATPAIPLRISGPGKLVLEGNLQVTTADGVRQAAKLTFGPGAFELDLQPQEGGYRIERAFLQGPLTLDG